MLEVGVLVGDRDRCYTQTSYISFRLMLTCSVSTLRPIHRIIKSLRLEKTSKNPQPKCSPPPPCCLRPSVPHLHGSGIPPGTVTPPLPGQLCHCITTLSEKFFFLISNPNLPWHNLRPFLLVLSFYHQREPHPPPSSTISIATLCIFQPLSLDCFLPPPIATVCLEQRCKRSRAGVGEVTISRCAL